MANAICISQKKYIDTILVIRQYSDTARKFNVIQTYEYSRVRLDTPIIYAKYVIRLKKDTIYVGRENNVYWGYFYEVRQLHNTRENQTDRELTLLYTNGNYVPGENEYWIHLYYLSVTKLPLAKSIIIWQSIDK